LQKLITMKEVTAVNWLINKLITENEVSLKGENYKLFELAKEMEREQIMEAHNQGYADGYRDNGNSPIDYYNETYKSE
jgi:hypothetical protein